MNKLVEAEKQEIRNEFPQFGPGDTLKVSYRIHEGKKDRVQAFQGVCIKIRGSGPNRSFVLRKISQGIGVERIFPFHSPLLEKVEIVRYGKVRRAKLYYLRDKVGKGRYVAERIVRKKDATKKRSKKAVKTAEQDSKEASVSKEATAQTVKPAEDSTKEAVDAKDESGSGGVEEG